MRGSLGYNVRLGHVPNEPAITMIAGVAGRSFGQDVRMNDRAKSSVTGQPHPCPHLKNIENRSHRADNHLMRKPLLILFLTTTAAFTSACSSPPVVQLIELTQRPSQTVPLAAVVTLQTDQPTTVSIELSDGEHTWSAGQNSELATRHEVPLLGMRPDRLHTVSIEVSDAQGRIASSLPLEITTPPLPENFPPLETRVSEPDRMEPGFTMFDTTYRGAEGPDEPGPLVIVDAEGEVVWYYWADHGVGDARRLRNGNILYLSGRDGRIYEIDMLGNVISQWTANRADEDKVLSESTAINTDTFHHEVFETASGNFLTVGSELRTFDDYPSSDTNPNAPASTSEVVGDTLVEFSRDGRLLREVKLLDLVDPYRIGYNSLAAGFWTPVYGDPAPLPRRDWAHTNAVVMGADERYAIASLRHQDAVVKIDMETGELVWILGNHGGWGPQWQDYLLEPNGDVLWPYHQHAPMITPAGTLLMFDNGNERARPFEARTRATESFSRAVEYNVDEATMEVSELWSYGGSEDERYYAGFVGDADWMPETGNILINFGGLVSDADGNFTTGRGHNWSRIVEVTHDTPAEKIFELLIDAESPEGWFAFRAERLPNLYP